MKKVAFDLCYLADSLSALWACLNFYNSLITCTSLLCFPVRLLSSQLLVVRMMAVTIVRGKQCWGCGGFTEWKHRGLNAKLAILRIVLLHMACSCHMTSWLAQRQLISDPLLQTNWWILKTVWDCHPLDSRFYQCGSCKNNICFLLCQVNTFCYSTDEGLCPQASWQDPLLVSPNVVFKNNLLLFDLKVLSWRYRTALLSLFFNDFITDSSGILLTASFSRKQPPQVICASC